MRSRLFHAVVIGGFSWTAGCDHAALPGGASDGGERDLTPGSGYADLGVVPGRDMTPIGFGDLGLTAVDLPFPVDDFGPIGVAPLDLGPIGGDDLGLVPQVDLGLVPQIDLGLSPGDQAPPPADLPPPDLRVIDIRIIDGFGPGDFARPDAAVSDGAAGDFGLAPPDAARKD